MCRFRICNQWLRKWVSGAEAWQATRQTCFPMTCDMSPGAITRDRLPRQMNPVGDWSDYTPFTSPPFAHIVSFQPLFCSLLAGRMLAARPGEIRLHLCYKGLPWTIHLGVVHSQLLFRMKDIWGVQSVTQGNMFCLFVLDLLYEQRARLSLGKDSQAWSWGRQRQWEWEKREI